MTNTVINVSTHDNDTTDISLTIEGTSLTASLGTSSSTVVLPASAGGAGGDVVTFKEITADSGVVNKLEPKDGYDIVTTQIYREIILNGNPTGVVISSYIEQYAPLAVTVSHETKGSVLMADGNSYFFVTRTFKVGETIVSEATELPADAAVLFASTLTDLTAGKLEDVTESFRSSGYFNDTVANDVMVYKQVGDLGASDSYAWLSKEVRTSENRGMQVYFDLAMANRFTSRAYSLPENTSYVLDNVSEVYSQNNTNMLATKTVSTDDTTESSSAQTRQV